MNIKIGIIRKTERSRELPKVLIRNAKIIGKEIIKKGFILVSGACMGIPNIAVKSALKEGGFVFRVFIFATGRLYY